MRPGVVVAILLMFVAALAAPALLAAQVAQSATAAVTGGELPTSPAARETAEWGSSLIWAFVSSSLMEFLKRRGLLAMSERMTFVAQRVLGFVLAALTALGIHASFSYDQVAGKAIVEVSGLLWPSISAAFGETLRQWVLQELTFRTAVKNFRKDA